MYKVKFTIDGLLKEMTVNANDSNTAMNIVINMYGNGKIQIIDIRRL